MPASLPADGGVSSASGESRLEGGATQTCPGCGADLADTNLRKAERVAVSRVVGTRRQAALDRRLRRRSGRQGRPSMRFSQFLHNS